MEEVGESLALLGREDGDHACLFLRSDVTIRGTGRLETIRVPYEPSRHLVA